jgi:hypothetical protein
VPEQETREDRGIETRQYGHAAVDREGEMLVSAHELFAPLETELLPVGIQGSTLHDDVECESNTVDGIVQNTKVDCPQKCFRV